MPLRERADPVAVVALIEEVARLLAVDHVGLERQPVLEERTGSVGASPISAAPSWSPYNGSPAHVAAEAQDRALEAAAAAASIGTIVARWGSHAAV